MAGNACAEVLVQMQRPGNVPGQQWHNEVAAAILASMIREDRLSYTASNTCCKQRGNNQAQASSLEGPARNDFCKLGFSGSRVYTMAIHGCSPIVAVRAYELNKVSCGSAFRAMSPAGRAVTLRIPGFEHSKDDAIGQFAIITSGLTELCSNLLQDLPKC